MANKDELITLIKFQISRLSERNAQFEFEHLCRHIARARICSNIVPATGPVARTGDQGRDFETFKTYLEKTDIANNAFIGLISEDMLAFACSIQQDNIENKILSDVKKITDSGTKIEKICFFSSAAIKVAINHRIKEKVMRDYEVPIDIFDIEWISENLADSDTFWIANKYLSISSETYPRPRVESEWYQKTYEKWKNKDDRSYNYGEFGEIKIAIRYALETEEIKPDIPFWLELLKSFYNKSLPSKLDRKIIYEAAVISFKALKDLKGHESFLRKYFDDLEILNDVGDYQDYFSLLLYSFTACINNVVALELDEIINWVKLFVAKLDAEIIELEDKDKNTLFCHLLFLRGALILKFKEGSEAIDECLNYWEKLLNIVDKVPLFPLKILSEAFIKFSEILSKSSRYQDFTTKIDNFLASRSGRNIAAKNCRSRAKSFYKRGEILRALEELHQAKIDWFTDDTLPQAVFTVINISGWYRELGLNYASKYYALAAALAIDTTEDPRLKFFLPRALFSALESDYLQGAWCSFMNLSKVIISAHVSFEREPFDLEKHELIRNLLLYVSYVIYFSKRFNQDISKVFIKKGYSIFEEDLLKSSIDLVAKQYDSTNLEEIWKLLEEQLKGRPFNDVAPTREIIWSELGIEWHIKWENTYEITPIAEQYVAILQILLADYAKIDLCLLKSTVRIELDIHEKEKSEVEPFRSNEGTIWKIKLPKTNGTIDNVFSHLSTIATILEEISVLKRDIFVKKFTKHFDKGLQFKTYIANTYETLYRRYINEDLFNECNSVCDEIPKLNYEFKIDEHEELKWFYRTGPSYDEERNKEYVRVRYEKLLKNLKYTLPRLLKETEFQDIIHELKAEGWLDWHILNVVADIVSFKRIIGDKSKIRNFEDFEKIREDFIEEVFKEEDKDSPPISHTIFNKETMIAGLIGLMISSLELYDLEYHQVTPDYKALRHFLENRYNYLSDDIEHEDPFKKN